MQARDSNWISKLARPEICAMTPYSSARREQQQGQVWLNANENPWPTLSSETWNRYPDPQPLALLQCLAKIYQVAPNSLLVARGSDEIIDLLLRVFCAAGKDAIVTCPPTYGMYEIAAIIQNAAIVPVPLIKDQDFSLDVAAILQNYKSNIKLIFLCSPNNPTGNLLSQTSILLLCQKLQEKCLVVVDEAYIEFSQAASMSHLISTYPNLIIMRTLSKAYGLAGVRCGAVIAHPAIITLLQKVLAPYPIPSPIAELILSHLTAEYRKNAESQVKILQQQRDMLLSALEKISMVQKVWSSEANFILIKVDDATRIMQCCYVKGIIIRDRSREYGLQNCVRITVGTIEENKFLLEVLANV